MEEEKRIKELKERIIKKLSEMKKGLEYDKEKIKSAEIKLDELLEIKYETLKDIISGRNEIKDIETKLNDIIEYKKEKISEIKKEKLELDKLMKEIMNKYPLLSEEEILGGKMEEVEKSIQEGEELKDYSEESKRVLLKISEVREVISQHEERIKTEMGKEFKEAILSNDNKEMIYVEAGEFDSASYKKKEKTFNGVMPKKIIDLSEKYGGEAFFPIQTSFDYGPHGDYTFGYDVKKTVYDDCTLEQKQMIKEKEQQLEKLYLQVQADQSGQYDKVGKVKIPLYNKWASKSDEVEVDITQRELVLAGLLPDDLGWKSLEQIEKESRKKTKISSKDIAKASKEKGIEKSEEKGIWGNIVDRIKNIFNERGE